MKRTLRLFVLALLLPASLSAFECPGAGEAAEDCPWAGAARLMSGKDLKGIGKIMAEYAPGLLVQMDSDSASPELLRLWGQSINYDEFAKGRIVDDGILSFIASRLGAGGPNGRLMHAGAEHTYGYLFSLLPTQFGFKRARWVRPDIEAGLGLPTGSAGPAPSEGTLLANITCLAGGIALQDDPAAAALLKDLPCAGALKAYSFSGVARTRLTEYLELPGDRAVSLRTDFVPFGKSSGGNTHLLVYSVYDSAAKQAYLVTAFPVDSAFVRRAVDPKGLGAGKPVKTRYNAYVQGVTGSENLKGYRRAETFGK